MDSKLTMPFENELTNEEITSIDEYVERTYEEHKNNHKELTRLGMQASAAVARESKSRRIGKSRLF